MAVVRRLLRHTALAWLLCQAATLTVSPAVYWFDSAENLLECKCTHGDHAVCPMHHKPAPGSRLCLMKSPDNAGAGVITTLLGVGVIPAPLPAMRSEIQSAVLLPGFRAASLRPAPPDPPPPRL